MVLYTLGTIHTALELFTSVPLPEAFRMTGSVVTVNICDL